MTSIELCCAPACGGGRSSQASQSAQKAKQLQQLFEMAFLLAESTLDGSCSASREQGRRRVGVQAAWDSDTRGLGSAPGALDLWQCVLTDHRGIGGAGEFPTASGTFSLLISQGLRG